jgi:hypothetical protein
MTITTIPAADASITYAQGTGGSNGWTTVADGTGANLNTANGVSSKVSTVKGNTASLSWTGRSIYMMGAISGNSSFPRGPFGVTIDAGLAGQLSREDTMAYSNAYAQELYRVLYPLRVGKSDEGDALHTLLLDVRQYLQADYQSPLGANYLDASGLAGVSIDQFIVVSGPKVQAPTNSKKLVVIPDSWGGAYGVNMRDLAWPFALKRKLSGYYGYDLPLKLMGGFGGAWARYKGVDARASGGMYNCTLLAAEQPSDVAICLGPNDFTGNSTLSVGMQVSAAEYVRFVRAGLRFVEDTIDTSSVNVSVATPPLAGPGYRTSKFMVAGQTNGYFGGGRDNVELAATLLRELLDDEFPRIKLADVAGVLDSQGLTLGGNRNRDAGLHPDAPQHLAIAHEFYRALVR